MWRRTFLFIFVLAWLAASLIPASAADQVFTGIDVLEQDRFQELQGKKIGLVTNQTGKDRKGRSTVEILTEASNVELKALFVPEHGFAGKLQGMSTSSDTFRLSDGRGIPIYAAFGASAAPTRSMLSGLDAVVIDIQDIGTRFYTYATTMAMIMETAAKYGLDVYVLDRPNPVTGDIVEGPILDPGIRASTAYFQTAIRHGLTMGEIAWMYNASHKIGAKLHVVPLKGWSRGMWYDQTGLPWTQLSPNMPDLEAATLYPGLGCLERTNISVGRETSLPFRWIGAPWLNADKVLEVLQAANPAGVEFELKNMTPTGDNYSGQKCRGIRIRVTDREQVRPLHILAVLVCALREVHPKEFDLQWDGAPGTTDESKRFFLPTTHRLIGTDKFLELYKSGATPRQLMDMFDLGAKQFKLDRQPYLLY